MSRPFVLHELIIPVPIPDEVKKLTYIYFYFHNALWCLEKFYEGLKDLHKTFWGTTKKLDGHCE